MLRYLKPCVVTALVTIAVTTGKLILSEDRPAVPASRPSLPRPEVAPVEAPAVAMTRDRGKKTQADAERAVPTPEEEILNRSLAELRTRLLTTPKAASGLSRAPGRRSHPEGGSR